MEVGVQYMLSLKRRILFIRRVMIAELGGKRLL
jgi:hypothetical protein